MALPFDLSRIATPPRYRHCATCGAHGEMVQRNDGYAILCSNPACIAPTPPYTQTCPTRTAAEQCWTYLQGGAR